MTYLPPLDQFLKLGRPRRYDEQADPATLGLGREHIPELVRMALDEELYAAPEESTRAWAPIHALRALGRLRAVEAVGPLLSLLRRVDEQEDDWIGEDLPQALAEIGASAVTPTADYLADASHGQWARYSATEILAKIGQAHPETRTACIQRLTAQLALFREQTEEFNAFLVAALMDLRAVEAGAIIEAAYADDRVDEGFCGDWEEVAFELGLSANLPPPRRPALLPKDALATDWSDDAAEPDALTDDSLAPDPKVGRNDPCPCGSGKKFKKCCGP